MLKELVLVGVGSAIGGIARHLVTLAMTARFGPLFPWGTLAANVSGSLVMGLLAGVAMGRLRLSADLQLLLMTGFCGGYTTFSAFALQTVALGRDGPLPVALGYVAASVIACVLAAWLGAVVGRAL